MFWCKKVKILIQIKKGFVDDVKLSLNLADGTRAARMWPPGYCHQNMATRAARM